MVKKNMISNSSEKIINKGAWTAEEDRKLAEYVKTHGDKKWRSLAAKAGLNRTGKSCRLRWLNYLRPGIKRGNISEDEEDLIIRLHNLLGNRWALIAGRLPGRTDNEIRNHWNTHLRKKALTINELKDKVNQENKASSERSLALPTMDGPDFPSAPLDPSNQSKALVGAQAASRPINELPEEEIYAMGFFDMQPMVSDLPGSVERENGYFEVHGPDFRSLAICDDLLSTGLPGSNGQYFDEQIAYNQLDFDMLAKLLVYEDDAFFMATEAVVLALS